MPNAFHCLCVPPCLTYSISPTLFVSLLECSNLYIPFYSSHSLYVHVPRGNTFVIPHLISYSACVAPRMSHSLYLYTCAISSVSNSVFLSLIFVPRWMCPTTGDCYSLYVPNCMYLTLYLSYSTCIQLQCPTLCVSNSVRVTPMWFPLYVPLSVCATLVYAFPGVSLWIHFLQS